MWFVNCKCVADPNMMPTMRVDKGAISFVMNGANIMCAGFTSKGGRMETPLEAGSPVVRYYLISGLLKKKARTTEIYPAPFSPYPPCCSFMLDDDECR